MRVGCIQIYENGSLVRDLVKTSLRAVGVTEYAGAPCHSQSDRRDVCLNAGTCIARLDEFLCVCVPPYNGRTCSSGQYHRLLFHMMCGLMV